MLQWRRRCRPGCLQGPFPRFDNAWTPCSVWQPAGASTAPGVQKPRLQTRTFYNLTSYSPIIVYHQSLNISLFLHLSQGQNGVNFTQVTLGQVSSRPLFSFLSILENSSSKALMDLALRLPPVSHHSLSLVSQLCQTSWTLGSFVLLSPDAWGLPSHLSKCRM